MFKPNEIIFALTDACNLACTHCTVSRKDMVLDIDLAKQLIDLCNEFGIERIGFSGGEPFLASDALAEIVRYVRERDLFFDRIMTNGVWYKTNDELEETLKKIFDAGFDGTICVSFDKYHQQTISKLVLFVETVFSIAETKENIELACVYDEDPCENKVLLENLAQCINGILEWDFIPYRIVDTLRLNQECETMFDSLGIHIPITHIMRSKSADTLAWNDTEWFTDDFCAGPGNVLYVHADGTIAACCGFANEREQLIVGTLKDSLSRILSNAARNPYIRWCYEQGLGTLRSVLETKGYTFPGKTRDMCGFCDFVCTNKLERLVGPPGFEPGTNGL